MVNRLPEALDTFQVPEYLSPSTFFQIRLCALSVFHGLSDDDKLPPYPTAILGDLVHSALQRANQATDSDPISIFNDLLKAEQKTLSSSRLTRNLVPLKKTIDRNTWRKRLSKLRHWTRPAGANPVRSNEGNGWEQPVSEQVNLIQYGYERPIKVPELRLSGRLDHIRKGQSNRIYITDYKTGRANDRNSQVYDSISLQLQLYALMVQYIQPDASIHLFIKGNEDIELGWDSTIARNTKKKLLKTLARFPSKKTLDAKSNATVGRHCSLCRIRHRCSKYLDTAPSLWHNQSSERPVAPNDIWGKIIGMNNTQGTTELTICDASGRSVNISGIEKWLTAGSIKTGENIWFFDLEPSGNIRQHGFYTHPCNFHGENYNFRDRKAVRLSVFC